MPALCYDLRVFTISADNKAATRRRTAKLELRTAAIPLPTLFGTKEIVVFRQTPEGAIAAAVSDGSCERVRIFLSLDELVKLRWMIVQAKARLDEIK